MCRKIILQTGLIILYLSFLTACPMGDGVTKVEGRILSDNGNPIKGAKVVLMSRGEKTDSQSRDDGSFNVMVVRAPGTPTGTLTVSKEGYQTYQHQFNSQEELDRDREIVLKASSPPKVESK